MLFVNIAKELIAVAVGLMIVAKRVLMMVVEKNVEYHLL